MMHPFLHSPWLEANLERLGWTLLHFLWQGAFVAALLGMELAVPRHASARLRYLAAVVAAAAAMLMPLLTFAVLHPAAQKRAWPVAATSNGRTTVPVTVTLASSQTAAEAAPPVQSMARPASRQPSPRALSSPETRSADSWQQTCQKFLERTRLLLPWCVAAWALGVSVLSLRLLVGWTATQKLCHQGTRLPDPRWQASLERLAHQLGIRRVVRLLESTLAEVPAVIGTLRPVILLPVGMLTGLSMSQVEMILAHELAHVRRQDYLVNLGLTLFETLGFYHPAVWWIAARVREEREHACDDLAVQASGGDSVEYARALARLEELRGPAADFALAATSGGSGNLLKRVRRMLGMPPPPLPDTGRVAGWLAGVLALVLVVALTFGAPRHLARAQAMTRPISSASLDMYAVPATRPPAPDAPIGPRDLAGHVVDAQAQGLVGATVSVVGAYPEVFPINTDATGAFRFPDFGDRHYVCLEVERGGYGTRWEGDLAVGRDFTVRMENTTRLRGRLYKPDNLPTGPATVVLFKDVPTRRADMHISGLRVERRTDANGAYDFAVEPGTYQIEITADDENLVARHDRFEVPADRVTQLPLGLQPGLTLRIRTVDGLTGQPAPGARFYVREQKNSFTIGARPGSKKRTDADGYARWDRLFPGRMFLDVDRDPTYARFWSTDPREVFHANAPKGKHPTGSQAEDQSLYIDVQPGRTDEPVVVQTERGVQVSGRVLDPQGRPLENSVVRAVITDPADTYSPAGTFFGLNGFQARTAADGTFHGCVPAGNGGSMRLVADLAEPEPGNTFGNGISEPFPSLPGEAREVTVRLTNGGWIEGSVVDPQGKPLAKISVSAAVADGLDGYVNHIGFETDAQGHFRLGPLRPAEYDVTTRDATLLHAGPEDGGVHHPAAGIRVDERVDGTQSVRRAHRRPGKRHGPQPAAAHRGFLRRQSQRLRTVPVPQPVEPRSQTAGADGQVGIGFRWLRHGNGPVGEGVYAPHLR